MSDQQITLLEYEHLRREILERIKILHLTINVAILLWAIFILAGLWLFYADARGVIFTWYLLALPPVFLGLLFNYQDNQRTMEGVAKYIEEEIKPRLQKYASQPILGWEQFLAKRKAKYQISSSFKLFSLAVPLLIPIFLLLYNDLVRVQIWVAVFELLLLVIALGNFRYKLNRVK